jgi:hypothetical protein
MTKMDDTEFANAGSGYSLTVEYIPTSPTGD